ncbi:MAG: hypothetical protein QMC88_03605 [Thermodesulfovibrio yellowstonii]|nr:hypothetical protein [Thermodesulfovibrio yellowstonii]
MSTGKLSLRLAGKRQIDGITLETQKNALHYVILKEFVSSYLLSYGKIKN